MIVTTKDDVVSLSGALVKNYWLTIQAAANLLLKEHPEGIIIDCSELDHVSADGAKTFLDAMKDIEAAGARMVVTSLPEDVLQVLRTVRTVRSQLPIAASVEEARKSLRLSVTAGGSNGGGAPTEHSVVVPLLPALDVEHAFAIAARVAKEMRAPVHLVYLLEVARHLPLSSPLPAEEDEANRVLSQGNQLARKHNLQPVSHLERVRDLEEGILQVLKSYKADHVILGAFSNRADDELFHSLVTTLLHRAPCNVLIARKALDADSGASPVYPG